MRRHVPTLLTLVSTMSMPVAFAQTGTGSNDNRDRRTPDAVTDRAGQPGDRSAAMPALLQQLEGTWRVDIRVNADHWMDKAAMNDPKKSTADANRDRSGDAANKPNANQPGTTGNQPSPDQNRDMSGMKSCTGYAVSDLIMGGKILRQSFASTDMGEGKFGHSEMRPGIDANSPGAPSKTGNNQPGSATDSGRTGTGTSSEMIATTPLDSSAFRGLSFISFDPQNDTYSAVFMDSRSGAMHTHWGKFDATARRIVFEGSGDEGMGTKNADKQPGRGGANDPSKSASGMDASRGNPRVVVEILSNDQHRVTMYKGIQTASSNTETAGRGNGPTADVIYVATYTRASDADRTKIRGLLSPDLGFQNNNRGGTSPTPSKNNR